MTSTAACDDGDACTTTDHCTSGVCAGTAKTCSASDACHEAGTCQTDGACSNPEKKDPMPTVTGSCEKRSCETATGWQTIKDMTSTAACDDGNTCTSDDKCSAGTCTGAAIATDDSDPCTDDICTAGETSHTLKNGALCSAKDKELGCDLTTCQWEVPTCTILCNQADQGHSCTITTTHTTNTDKIDGPVCDINISSSAEAPDTFETDTLPQTCTQRITQAYDGLPKDYACPITVQGCTLEMQPAEIDIDKVGSFVLKDKPKDTECYVVDGEQKPIVPKDG
jgi:hypothetical protein